MKIGFHNGYRITGIMALMGFLLWENVAENLFQDPVSTVLEDRSGALMGAMIADDGQWRFPTVKEVPDKFRIAITVFEDKRFYNHPGVDILAFGRAFSQNIKSGSVVSGGSTLTMQVIRLSRKGRNRGYLEKVVESFQAIMLESAVTKDSILKIYASHAPFGGNIVGLEAASWRYYGKSPQKLSWAEAACLAVLPNSPSLVNPGKNRSILKAKRDRLLDRLLEQDYLDRETHILAKMEPVPQKPGPLPRLSPHLLAQAYSQQSIKSRYRSTIDKSLQEQVNHLALSHHKSLKENGVNNLAVLVLDVESGEIISYCGNVPKFESINGYDVDVIPAPRSSGSILKPFLYAFSFQEGYYLPKSLLPDIPVYFGSFTPKNYNYSYDGAVTASSALARSLNVPSVLLLRDYGYKQFYFQMKKMGMSTLQFSASHYGLALILGGAETSLLDLAGMYGFMAQKLNRFGNQGVHSTKGSDNYTLTTGLKKKQYGQDYLLDPAAIYLTFEAMTEVKRPKEESAWKEFGSATRIAWKTGTSFGHRDAWAVGVTPEYVVAVWAGNADGEGRPQLVGSSSAAPLMFDIFHYLKPNKWFDKPYDNMIQLKTCKESGFKASSICSETVVEWVPEKGINVSQCPYHQIIHTDSTGKYLVDSECYPVSEIKQQPWFTLPATMQYYYKKKHSGYRNLPEVLASCNHLDNTPKMEVVYPKQHTGIFLPIDLNGEKMEAVFEAVHNDEKATIHWHLNEQYLGSTTGKHLKPMSPNPGHYVLTLVDNYGERIIKTFDILEE